MNEYTINIEQNPEPAEGVVAEYWLDDRGGEGLAVQIMTSDKAALHANAPEVEDGEFVVSYLVDVPGEGVDGHIAVGFVNLAAVVNLLVEEIQRGRFSDDMDTEGIDLTRQQIVGEAQRALRQFGAWAAMLQHAEQDPKDWDNFCQTTFGLHGLIVNRLAKVAV